MRVVANITSKYGTRGYLTVPVSQVENYMIDSALDTDTDQFSIDIGDPSNQLITLLNRDSEVRMALSAATRSSGLSPILKGYADIIALRHDGILSIQGRDLSSAAVDTTAKPHYWRNARPAKIIADSASTLGFSKSLLDIAPISVMKKLLYTDGSESEWDFWYRMVRQKQMWIWCDSDGILHVDQLNYSSKPSYYFGEPTKEVPHKDHWIRIQEAEVRKNTQTRVGEVWVFGETGKIGFGPIKSSDPNIKDWIKKPLKIITSDQAHTNRATAIKEANEEIFEGIVGSIEITITISDPGFPIRQNTVAMLNLPAMDYRGEFFVVGTKISNGTNGAVQEVRLREKKYALTKRIPKAPQLKETRYNISQTAFGASLNIPKPDWGEYFIASARAHHGPWDLNLFLAALLAICERESTFRNVRESGQVEWYQEPASNQSSPQKPDKYSQWQRDFANSAGNPLNPFSREAGVGPMQLTDVGFKIQADNYLGIHGEYSGARWHPQANIWVGGSVLAGKLEGLPVSDANFRLGLQRYNGSGAAAVAYGNDVWNEIKTKWLPMITAAEAAAQNVSAEMASQLQDIATAPDVIKKIVQYAWSKRGDPYVSGASGPNKFDCSGLAYAAYQAAGLGGRIGGRQSTYGYWASGKGYGDLNRVTEKGQLLPGDMVFFDNFLNEEQPGHMGVYYSHGQMIHAPTPGEVVAELSISVQGLKFMGGMRLKGLWPANPSSDPIHPGPN